MPDTEKDEIGPGNWITSSRIVSIQGGTTRIEYEHCGAAEEKVLLLITSTVVTMLDESSQLWDTLEDYGPCKIPFRALLPP